VRGEAQNPDELFDVVDYNGRSTGVSKRRADIHRDGDWHRSVHIWVVGEIDGSGSIIFQRRSLAKDTSPGKLDPSVGGHLGAGETWRAAVREADEEIGLAISESDLIYAGTRLGINESDPAIIDREIQDVFFVRRDGPLDVFAPNSAEVSGLVRLGTADALEMFSGDRSVAAVEVMDAESRRIARSTIDRAEFGAQTDRYVYRVAIAARAFLAGERHFSV
jgi:isopentenyldiphosphate isomerase